MSTAPDRLSLDDARILGLESAAITGHTCKVAIVEPPPDGRAIGIEELRGHVAARLGRVRRCRQRVALVPLRLARPVWVDYPDFDIREHLRRYDADDVIDRPRLLRIAAELMAERLDHTRPLWQMDLVGPLEGGGSAIVWRIHHCMADGVTATRLGAVVRGHHALRPLHRSRCARRAGQRRRGDRRRDRRAGRALLARLYIKGRQPRSSRRLRRPPTTIRAAPISATKIP